MLIAIMASRVWPESVKSSRTIIAFRSISIALLIGFLMRDVSGHHTMMCYRQEGSWGLKEYKNFSGLGTHRIHILDEPTILRYWSQNSDDLRTSINSATFWFKFKLYPLYYSNGNHMTGWYRLQINNGGQPGQRQDWIQTYGTHILHYYVWAQNENYEFVGEWLTDDQFQPINDPRFKNCPKNDATRYMGISCGGAYPTQPSVPNTVRFIAQTNSNLKYFNFTNSTPFIGPPVHMNNLTEVNYYFRLSAQSCDTVKRDPPARPEFPINGILFSIKAFTWSSTSIPHGSSGTNIHQVMYEVTQPGAILGGADPLDPTGEVMCDKSINEYDNRGNNTNFPWFAKSFHPISWYTVITGTTKRELDPENDWNVNREYGCQAKLFGGRCKHNLNTPLTYTPPLVNWWSQPVGYLKQQNIAKLDVNYHCNNENVKKYVPLNEGTIIDYSDFLTKPSVNFMGKCPTVEETCSNRIVPIDGKTITTYPVTEYDLERGFHVKHFKSVWNLRKGHGIMMVILTVFLIPVSAFIARYFKESFMDRRIFYARIWFTIHSHVSGWIFAFTFAGAFVAFVSSGALGKSLTEAAKTHHILAYISYAILVLVFIGSGLRSYDEGGRMFCICCHWALGTLLYLVNVGALLTSMWIPASPIALIDHSLSPELLQQFNRPSGFDLSFVLIIGWLVFDVLAQLIMTVGIMMSDKEMQVIPGRLYSPSPIPVIREGQTASADGSAFRTIILFIYISVSILVTAGLCYIITFESSPVGRGFGPMTCTHFIDEGVIKSKLPKMRADCNY